MNDEQKGFKVKDRRLFTPDGERRVTTEDEPPEMTPPAPARAGASEAREAPIPGLPAGVADDESDFQSFLLGLGAQAAASLQGGKDLASARHIIGILEMLQRKTLGHRTPEEDQVLEGLLYELRLAYVERNRKAPA